MVKNVNTIDQIIRVVLGIGLVALVFVGPKTQWGWLGLILIATGAMNFCPIYRALGLSTRKKTA